MIILIPTEFIFLLLGTAESPERHFDNPQKPVKVLNKVDILNIRYGPHKTVSKHVYAHFYMINI